jgi:hypothetical protein
VKAYEASTSTTQNGAISFCRHLILLEQTRLYEFLLVAIELCFLKVSCLLPRQHMGTWNLEKLMKIIRIHSQKIVNGL